VKRIESLLHTESKKFEFENLESCFHQRQVSFLVVKTAKFKFAFVLQFKCAFIIRPLAFLGLFFLKYVLFYIL